MSFNGGHYLAADIWCFPAYGVDYCRITDNLSSVTGDHEEHGRVHIGGQWGTDGYSVGNIYGPRLATGPVAGFPADKLWSTQRASAARRVPATTACWIFIVALIRDRNYRWRDILSQSGTDRRGGTSGRRLAQVDFLCGQSAGTHGGFNFWQISNDGTIKANVGIAGLLLANDGYGNTQLWCVGAWRDAERTAGQRGHRHGQPVHVVRADPEQHQHRRRDHRSASTACRAVCYRRRTGAELSEPGRCTDSNGCRWRDGS